jgi:AAA+ superfamily predicted ATPase
MNIAISGVPLINDQTERTIFSTKIIRRVNEALTDGKNEDICITVDGERKITVKKTPSSGGSGSTQGHTSEEKSDDKEEKKEESTALSLQEPQFTFDQLVLEDKVMEELQYSIKFESVRNKVYEEWGLKKIDPSPKLALNFHGPAGTGKTMAAQAIASVMKKKIILASYAEIESKYHGDGPKNVKKLFNFASENDAVLFIDEADSLLSRRLINVTQGSEQAINSMRSQLLIQIEQYRGVVIFATNLAENYDGAFVTRIKSIHFKKPDQEMRKKLWEKQLFDKDMHLPLSPDIDIEKLSAIEDICGRDIKNGIVKAAIKSAIDNIERITQEILETSIKNIIEANKEIAQKEGGTMSEEAREELGRKIKQKLKKDRIRKRHIGLHSLMVF